MRFCFGQIGALQIIKPKIISEAVSYDSVKMDWNNAGRIQMELNDGMNNLHESNFGIAIQNFSDALKLDSTLTIARYYRGVTHKLAGHLSLACADLRKAQPLDSSFFEGLLELGKTYQLLSKVDNARTCFLKAKAIRSLSPIPLYRLGALSIGVNNGDQARKFFLECLKIEPNFALAKVKLALLDMQIDSKNSIRMLTEVIEKDPRNKEALFYRYILKQSSDATSALDDLNALIALSPIDYRLRVMRGLMLVKQKDYSLAFSDLKKALQATTINQDVFRGHQSALDQTIDIQAAGYYLIAHMYGLQDADIERIKKAYCLLLVNDYEGAINTVHEVRGYKSNAFCFFLIGIAQEHRGNHQSALSSYQSALKLDPQIWEAHKKVAIYNTSVGKWREAEQEFSAAIALNQDFNSLYKLRGVARFLSEDYQGADQDFTHFLKIDSLDEEAIRGRAEALVKLGKIDQAISEYFKVYDTARMNQFNFEGLEKTVDLMARKGDTLSAIKLLHRFFINTLHRPANDLKFALLLNQQNIQLLKIHLEGFETFVVRHPEVYKPQETYIIKAASYSRLGDFDLAESYFKKAIDFNPYNGWIHIYRGRMYLKMGRKKEAIREWKKSEALGVNEAKEELKKLKK